MLGRQGLDSRVFTLQSKYVSPVNERRLVKFPVKRLPASHNISVRASSQTQGRHSIFIIVAPYH